MYWYCMLVRYVDWILDELFRQCVIFLIFFFHSYFVMHFHNPISCVSRRHLLFSEEFVLCDSPKFWSMYNVFFFILLLSNSLIIILRLSEVSYTTINFDRQISINCFLIENRHKVFSAAYWKYQKTNWVD